MNWADERYVRLYTRDTPDWLCLSFPAQGLFCLLLRKVDRAGVLPLGKAGRKGVFIAIGHVHQAAMLESALDELLADGCVELNSDQLVIPNFLVAQEAEASDKARARKHREKVRDLARAGVVTTRPDRHEAPGARDGGVPPRDATVTPCDETVTPSRTVPPVPSVPPEPLLLLQLAEELGAEWGMVPEVPQDHEKWAELEAHVRRLGLSLAKEVCLDDVEIAVREGRLQSTPKSLAWFAPTLKNARPRPTRPPPADEMLDASWLQLLGDRRAAVEAEWSDTAARLKRTAWPDALPKSLEEARASLVAKYTPAAGSAA